MKFEVWKGIIKFMEHSYQVWKGITILWGKSGWVDNSSSKRNKWCGIVEELSIINKHSFFIVEPDCGQAFSVALTS